MNVKELFVDRLLWQFMLAGGYVRVQVHPEHPELRIYNYTELAAYSGEWNEITRACRGLIVHEPTGEILARPFEKFHNHDEPDAPVLSLDEPVTVMDKMDGSLGILYPLPGGGHAIATRGSFASDQALHATAVWNERYAHRFTPAPGTTYLFEIIYPANRIVVDYKGLDDLVLLGSIDIATGASFLPRDSEAHGIWPGPTAEVFDYATFGEALAAEPRPGAEGYVVQRWHSETRVKIKQAEYVRLHRIVTGLNARTVWEYLGTSDSLDGLLEPLPEEFHPWVEQVAAELRVQATAITNAVLDAYEAIVAGLPEDYTRRDFALVAKEREDRAYLFRLADGRDIGEMTWKAVRPAADWAPSGVTHGEDAA